jgi:hypothetical protein
MNLLTRASLIVALSCFAADAHAASASGSEASKDATAHYVKGRALLEKGEYDSALGELRPSYETLPSPNTLLLIGHAERGLGHKVTAARTYEKVVRDAEERIKRGEERFTATQKEARRWLDALASSLGQLSIRVASAPEFAVLRVGGEVIAPRVERGTLLVDGLWIEPGKVVVRAADPSQSREVTAEVPRGGRVSVALDFAVESKAAPAPVLAPAPVPAKPAEPTVPKEPAPSGGVPTGAWVAGGVGVAGLALFGIFGSIAKGKYDDLQTCSPRCPESERGTADAGKNDQTVANIGLVVGGVGLATAAGIWLLAPKRGSTASGSTAVRLSPGSVALSGTF